MKVVHAILLCSIGFVRGYAPALAQVPRSLDSLGQYLRNRPPTDSNYVRALNRTAYKLIYDKADYETADSLLHQSERLAERIGWSVGLLGSYTNQATRWYLTNNPQKALYYFQKAAQFAEAKRMPWQVVYDQVANMAVAYEKLNQWEQVMKTSLRAIHIQEQYGLTPRPNVYDAVGRALKELGKSRQALPYYQKSLALAHASGDKRAIATEENHMGNLLDDLNQPGKALTHYRQSLRLAEELGFDLLQADALDNIARMMHALKRPAEGMPFALKSLQIAGKQHNLESMASANSTLSLLHEALNDYPKAETYLQEAMRLSQQRQDKAGSAEFAQRLATLYADQKKYRSAYELQLQKNNLVDSAMTVRTSAEVQRLVAHYETEKKEAQIQLLQKEKQLQTETAERNAFRINALLVVGLLLLLLGASVSAWLLNRARLRRLEEAQTLRKQIAHDLHDEIGSTLSSISLLSGMLNNLLDQNRPDTARRMIEKIYADARQILDAMDEIVWTINPGNDALRPVALRLREYAQPLFDAQNIRLTLDVPADDVPMSMDVRRNLYLIGKEAINNAAKYAQATEVTLRFGQVGGQLSVVIEDNGRGFEPDAPSVRTGQRSMRQRAEAIGGRLSVESTPGQGTRVGVLVG